MSNEFCVEVNSTKLEVVAGELGELGNSTLLPNLDILPLLKDHRLDDVVPGSNPHQTQAGVVVLVALDGEAKALGIIVEDVCVGGLLQSENSMSSHEASEGIKVQFLSIVTLLTRRLSRAVISQPWWWSWSNLFKHWSLNQKLTAAEF